MNLQSIILAGLVFIGWGVSAFFDKLTTNRLGPNGMWLWIFFTAPVLLLAVPFYFLSQKFGFDRVGVSYLILSAATNLLAIIAYYLLLLRADLSTAAPLTALYPALTALLAFIFLNEGITAAKITGIILSLIAIFFLSR